MDKFLLGVFIGVGLMAITISFILKQSENRYYKEGQVDCINGKIKYELRNNEQNEKVWQLIGEKK
jgi:hypothetical protein